MEGEEKREVTTSEVQCDKVVYVTLDEVSIQDLLKGVQTGGVMDLSIKLGIQVRRAVDVVAGDSVDSVE